MDNLLQWNGVMWQNAIVGNVWDDGFAATLNTNAVALRTATDPVFTDTTYNLDTVEVVDGATADIRLNRDDDNAVRIRGGTNITVQVANETITIAAPNFSDVEVYTTTALRNAATDIVWHHGDLAVAGGSTWVYTGTDQTAAAATVDGDWTELVTPSTQLDAMGALNQLNMNDGSTGGINDSLISSNIQRTSSAVTTSSSITRLNDVSYRSALPTPLNNSFLIWDNDNSRWTNSSSTVTDFQSVTVPNLQTRLGQIADETIPLTKVNNAIALDDLAVGPDATASGSGGLAYNDTSGVFTYTPPEIPTVSGLPSAPVRGSTAARYELIVPETGSASAVDWVAVAADTGDDAPVTVSDAEPSGPAEGDLWYYTGGDDEAGNEPGLSVWYEDADGTGNWTSTTSMYTVPAAPTGPAEDTSYNLQVTSAGEASWEPVADSGGGSSGGGSAPTDSTFITSATPPGSSFEVLTLTAGAASTQFYINGGVEYQNTSFGGDSSRRQSLWLTNPTGIVAGQFMLLSGGTPNASAEIWNCLLYTSPSPRDRQKSRMPSSA